MADGSPQGHYFSSSPSTASRPAEVALDLPDLSLRLGTDRGVFSAERIDTGTKVLLVELARPESMADLPEGVLVDLGAGYGPIAVTLALRHPDRTVVAVEVNERARELCRANAERAGVADRVEVVDPSGWVDRPVAAVVSNPPIRIGKAALHDLLDLWLGRIAPGGGAWLVVQRNLGADSLARHLRENGCTVERVGSRKGYRLLHVRPAP